MENLLAVLMLFFQTASAQIQVESAWAPATPPAARIAGGYLVIRNAGAAPDRLVGVTSPASSRVEMHVVSMESGVMKMRQVLELVVPAKGILELKPGAAHLMFVDLVRPFRAGGMIPLALRFERAGERKTDLLIRPVGTQGFK